MTRAQALVQTVIEMHGIATLAEVVACGLEAAEIDEIVAELVAAERVRWAPRPFGRRTMERPEPFGLVTN